jgi:hypothetical protein
VAARLLTSGCIAGTAALSMPSRPTVGLHGHTSSIPAEPGPIHGRAGCDRVKRVPRPKVPEGRRRHPLP